MCVSPVKAFTFIYVNWNTEAGRQMQSLPMFQGSNKEEQTQSACSLLLTWSLKSF